MDENLSSALTFGLFTLVTLLLTVFLIRKIKSVVWWQHLSKSIAILILGSITIILITFTYYSIEEYYEERPRKAESLVSVSLGMTYGDVLFIKGEPRSMYKGGQKLEFGVTIPKYYSNIVFYERSSKTSVMIRFNTNGKVVSISSFCETNPYEKIHGIHCTANVPIPKLANYSLMTDTSKDNLRRLYCYPELNTCLEAEKAKVDVIHVYDPMFYPSGLKYYSQ